MVNAIPKAGTSTIVALLKMLSSQNNFNLYIGPQFLHLPNLRDRKYVIDSFLG
jgi:hypothetical protein